MRRIAVEHLEIGARLGRDVGSPSDQTAVPLLRAGVRISESYRQSLTRAGIDSVWVDDAVSDGIEPLETLSSATRQRATAAIHSAFRRVSDPATHSPGMASEVVQEMHEVATLIVQDVMRQVHLAVALNDLSHADNYTLQHSLAVTTLGLSLGLRVMLRHGWTDALGRRRFDDLEQRLSLLGVGLLLHDIGKLAIPAEILQKQGPLTQAERRTMQEHPMLGLQILRQAKALSPLSKAVIRSHHERWNGSGYPDGLREGAIHDFPRIAAVADVFDALTSNRAYRVAMTTGEAYAFIVDRTGQDFAPEVAAVFRTVVAPYPPGTEVTLSDGRSGLVKEVHSGRVERPVVRVLTDRSGTPIVPLEVDLSTSADVTIVSGVRVSAGV